jgi:hypothetical protein
MVRLTILPSGMQLIRIQSIFSIMALTFIENDTLPYPASHTTSSKKAYKVYDW